MTTAVPFKQMDAEAPVSSMVQLVNHTIAKYQASMETLALPETTAHKEFSDWVREQKSLNKCNNDMKGNHLDDETNSTPDLSRNQIKELNDVGFECVTVTQLDNNDAIWELRFKELCQYQREHGDCIVPARYRTNPQLGHWVMTQRRHYQLLQKVKPCSITLERVRRLDNISFPWRIRLIPENVWQTRYAQLSRYRETYGDCLVPQRFHPNPQLGFWVNTQRRHYKLMKEGKKSCMTQERIQMLEASGFIWMTGYRTIPRRQ